MAVGELTLPGVITCGENHNYLILLIPSLSLRYCNIMGGTIHDGSLLLDIEHYSPVQLPALQAH
jgi:hypothetical protein